ncbi:MAG: TatD family hydrolase [Stackebrandtia sp.]
MSKSKKAERPAAPEPLSIPVVDNHTHLDIVVSGFDGGIEPDDARVIAELDAATAVGVHRVMQVGTDAASSHWAVGLAERDARVLAAVALHPNDAPRLDDLDAGLAEIDALAKHPRVAALGETGMDFYRTESDGRDKQERSFREHIAMAKSHGKALMIHDRDAHDDVLRVLDEAGAPDIVVMHCFSGDGELARECARRGYYMSFAGNLTFKNAANLREAARECPSQLLLVETDAPFLAPVPFRGRHNGPFLLPATVRFLADLLGRDLDALCTALSANTERAYGSWSGA